MLTPLRSKIGDLVASVIALRAKTAGAVTTLTANAAAGSTALTLAAVAGMDAADPLAVGAEEDAELVVQTGAPAGSVVNVIAPGLKRAHVSGEAVRELEAWDLGNAVNVRRADSADTSDNESDTLRNADGVRMGHLNSRAEFDLQGYSPFHYALLTGMPLTSVQGAGTLQDPTQLHTDGEDFCTEDTFIVLTQRKKDGTFLQHQFDACAADYTGVNIVLGQGREGMLAGRFNAANHGRQLESAPAFTTNFAQQIRDGARIETLLGAGYFRVLTGGLATTLTAPVAKGANVLALAAATGVAGGKYYLVSGAGKAQVVLAESLNILNLTLRTRAAYAFPTGATVVELEVFTFAGLKQNTTEFRTGGSVREIKYDNARVRSGHMAGSARFAMAFQPTALTLTNLRLQRGLPASAIAGGVLTESDLAGSDAPVGFWTIGQRRDTKTVQIIGSTVFNGLETLELMMGKNDLPAVPLTFRCQLQSQLMW